MHGGWIGGGVVFVVCAAQCEAQARTSTAPPALVPRSPGALGGLSVPGAVPLRLVIVVPAIVRPVEIPIPRADVTAGACQRDHHHRRHQEPTHVTPNALHHSCLRVPSCISAAKRNMLDFMAIPDERLAEYNRTAQNRPLPSEISAARLQEVSTTRRSGHFYFAQKGVISILR